jgi:hypothetical protein
MPSPETKRFALWLSHWAEEKERADSGELPDSLPPGITPVTSKVSRAFDSPDLVEGEIRVIDPWLVPDVRGPLFFVILQEWIDGMWLIAPFSRFPVPATVGEWDTGREHNQLGILSLWNAHTVPDSVLKRSWFVDVLEPRELENARAVFRHVATGATLPANLLNDIGPPMYHPADPRHEYLASDAIALSPLAELAREYVENLPLAPIEAEIADTLIPSPLGLFEPAVASSSASSGGISLILRVPSLGVRVTFRQDGSGKQVVARVTDLLSSKRSHKLDGGIVVKAKKAVGKFGRGYAEFTASTLAGQIGLRDRNGRPLQVEIETNRE